MGYNPHIRKIDDDKIDDAFDRTQRNIAHSISKADGEMDEALIYAKEMQRRRHDKLDDEGYTSELTYWTERVQNLKLAKRVLNEARLFANFNR